MVTLLRNGGTAKKSQIQMDRDMVTLTKMVMSGFLRALAVPRMGDHTGMLKNREADTRIFFPVGQNDSQSAC